MKFDTEQVYYFKGDHIDVWTKLYTDVELSKPVEDGNHVLSDNRIVVTQKGEVVFIHYKVNTIGYKIVNFSLFGIGLIIGVFITYLILSL